MDGEYSPKASLIFQLIKTIKSSRPVMSAGRELSSEEEVKNPAAPAPIVGVNNPTLEVGVLRPSKYLKFLGSEI